MSDLLVYAGGAVLLLWGVSHVAPTRSVVDSLGNISRDSRRIFVMEWVAEGVAQVSIAALVITVAAIAVSNGSAVNAAYRVAAVALLALAALTALTGARTPVVWFKACPFVLTTVAALLLAASAL